MTTFFDVGIQLAAEKHLASDPAHFVGLIIGRELMVNAVELSGVGGRSVEARTKSGETVVIDREAILAYQHGVDPQTLEERLAAEAKSEDLPDGWVAALAELRAVAIRSKDPKVVAAEAALKAIEEKGQTHPASEPAA